MRLQKYAVAAWQKRIFIKAGEDSYFILI